MNKRLLSLLLALCMVMILLPATAWAAGATSVTVGGKTLTNGKYLANGADSASDTRPATGGYVYFEGDGTTATLTLHNAEIDSNDYSYGIGTTTAGDLTIILEGTTL